MKDMREQTRNTGQAAHAGVARQNKEVVIDKPAGKARQDRREACRPWALHDLPSEVAVARELFRRILQMINGLRSGRTARC
jgi:hypothetical protein